MKALRQEFIDELYKSLVEDIVNEVGESMIRTYLFDVIAEELGEKFSDSRVWEYVDDFMDKHYDRACEEAFEVQKEMSEPSAFDEAWADIRNETIHAIQDGRY